MGNTESAPLSENSDTMVVESESPAHDDTLILSNETEEAKTKTCAVLLRPQLIEFTVLPSDPQWGSFKFLATKYIYSENAFPSEQRVKQMCLEIAHALNPGNNLTDTSYRIGHSLVRRFQSIGRTNRRNLHDAVSRWIRSFEWPVSAFPSKCSTSKAELYKHLTYHARFSRKDYEQDGKMLQNHCLTHCLNYVMYRDKSTRESFKHQQLDDPIPRPLVVYIMVVIHYNLEKLASKYERIQTKNYRGSVWSVYYPGQTWHRSEYRALLNPSSKQGRQLQWDRIIQIVSQKLDDLEEAEDDYVDDDALDDLLGPTM